MRGRRLPEQDGDADEQEREKIEGIAQKTSGQRLEHDGLHLMRIWGINRALVPWEGLEVRRTLTGLGNYCATKAGFPVCPTSPLAQTALCPACRDGRCGEQGVAGSGPATANIHWKTGIPGARYPQSLSTPSVSSRRGVDAALLGGIELGHHHLDVLQLLAQEWRLASMSWIME